MQRLKHLYNLLGQEQNAGLVVGPHPHGYSQENREAMYAWFGQATGSPHDRQEPTLRLEEDQTLWCTPRGQIATLEHTRTVFQCTQEKSRLLASQREPLRGEALLQAVRNVLKLPPLENAAGNAPGTGLPHPTFHAGKRLPATVCLHLCRAVPNRGFSPSCTC